MKESRTHKFSKAQTIKPSCCWDDCKRRTALGEMSGRHLRAEFTGRASSYKFLNYLVLMLLLADSLLTPKESGQLLPTSPVLLFVIFAIFWRSAMSGEGARQWQKKMLSLLLTSNSANSSPMRTILFGFGFALRRGARCSKIGHQLFFFEATSSEESTLAPRLSGTHSYSSLPFRTAAVFCLHEKADV